VRFCTVTLGRVDTQQLLEQINPRAVTVGIGLDARVAKSRIFELECR